MFNVLIFKFENKSINSAIIKGYFTKFKLSTENKFAIFFFVRA